MSQAIASFTLEKWSFVHATLCIAAVCAVFLLQNMAPLLLAGIFSFGLFVTIGRPQWTPHSGFGVANKITLVRLVLALILFTAGAASTSGIFVFVIALSILVLDGFDGWMARRRNETSEFGEYFDKETDAFFLLTLCLLAYFQQKIGAWIVIPGLLRYIFVVALVLKKPDVKKEYRSTWARIIFVTMIIALLSIFITPWWFYSPLAAAGTTGLFLSFAHYFRWLFSSQSQQENAPPGVSIVKATLAFFFLNSLLLIPSLIANIETSTFFPVPDPSQPIATLTWTRGWYDYVLYLFVRRPNQDVFRICADMVLLTTLLVLWAKRKPVKKTIPWPLIAVYLMLLIYEVYDAMVFQFFHRHGLMYEDIQYVLNLYYLAIDAFSPAHLFQLILILTGIVLFSWWLPVLFRAIINGYAKIRIRNFGLICSSVFWSIFIGCWFWFGPGDERPTVRSVLGKIGVNASESIQLAKIITSIEKQPVDQIYNNFELTPLARKVNIYIIMIESYGRVLHDNAYLRPAYDSLMYAFQRQFEEAGWLNATRYSRAPVSGGLSWLSMNSVLSGIFMKNRTFYTRYTARINKYPHLVRYLDLQGYYTLTLQPPNKARLGLPIENLYGFDKTIYFDDLHYTGTPYSIWVIPDQYSLGYTHENYLPLDQEAPFFLFFETATTHAPWTNLPPYVSDWKTLNESAISAHINEDETLVDLIKNSYRNRFTRSVPQAPDLYRESINYDLQLIKDYILNDAPENSLFIVLGDHQPPLIPSTNYDTPLHIISRDAHLIEHFTSYGFTEGMLASSEPAQPLTHAGIYSMLIDVLTFDPGLTSTLPSHRYRPEGVAPSVLTTSD